MDLKVYMPTFNIEQDEAKSLGEFLELLDDSANRQNAFFDESINGYVVLYNNEPLKEKEKEVYVETLQKAFISIDLSVHPAKNNVARELKRIEQPGTHVIKTFNYTFSNCIFNESISSENGDNEDEEFIEQFVTVWKFTLPISYPKKKINNPEILISILLTLSNYQTILQKIKLAEKYSNDASINSPNPKLMIHNNVSLDELTLKHVYKPAEEINIFQGLEPQVKTNELQTQNLPVLPVSKLLSHSESNESDSTFTLDNRVTQDFINKNADKRASMISNYSVIESMPKTLNLNAKILLPVYPVLNMRLKCTKSAGRNDILLTTLEIESSKELNKINTTLNLLEIDIEFPNGSIKPLIPSSLQKFPINLSYNDNLNFIYELINNNNGENMTKKPIMISLISQPISKDGDGKIDANSSKIITRWNTVVDFGIVAPPTSTALKSQNVQNSSNINGRMNGNKSKNHISNISSPILDKRNERNFDSSSSFSMGVNSDNTNDTSSVHQQLKSQTRTTSTSLTVNIPRTSKSSVLNGLVLSFHGTTNVKVGQIFKWKIQAINKSHKILNLSLYIQPKDNNSHLFLTTNMTEKLTPKLNNNNNSNSFLGPHNRDGNNQIIYPLTSSGDNINLTKVFNQTKLTPSGIICLNNDVRIGPFDHYSVFETEINLIAIEEGIFSLQGVKIIDISSGESFDCGKLLEVSVYD